MRSSLLVFDIRLPEDTMRRDLGVTLLKLAHVYKNWGSYLPWFQMHWGFKCIQELWFICTPIQEQLVIVEPTGLSVCVLLL